MQAWRLWCARYPDTLAAAADDLAVLLAVAQTLRASQDVARTRRAIVQAFLDVFPLKGAFLCTWQDRAERFELLAHVPNDAQDDARACLERYADRLRALWHAPQDRIPALANVDAAAQVVALPLVQRGRPTALLVLSLDTKISRHEQRLMALLAFQAGLALDDARRCQAARSERDQLRAIFDATDEAIFLLDLRGRLLRFNSAAEMLLGQGLAPYIGRSVLAWLRDIGREHFKQITGLSVAGLREYIWEIADQPLKTHRRQFTQRNNKEVRHIDEKGLPVLDHDGQLMGWLLVWRDNTEMRELEQMREELSSMIVHDLRNPITSITSSLMMLHDLITEEELEPGLLLDVVNIARSSADYMFNLVQSILDVARLEQNNLVLDRESAALADCIDYAATSVMSQARSAGITLQIDVPDDLPPMWVDAEKIQRVVVNLLDNAVRYTPQAGHVRLGARHDARADAVIICIEDTGPGVPPDARARIFDKYTQLGRRASRGYKGTGLGLAFCKMVVEAHGGMIWVEDAPSGGAAFCFSLPIQPPEAALGDVSPDRPA